MTERLMAKLDRLGAEAGIKQMTPEIYKFFQLINDDKNRQFGEATYWYYDKDGKLHGNNEVKLRISSTDNSLHFGAVPQHVLGPQPGMHYGMNQDDWKDIVAAISKARDSRGIYLGCRPADVFQDWFLAMGLFKPKEKNA